MSVRLKTTQAQDRQPVVIKGTKDGLVFLLDENCSFDRLIDYLRHLLSEGESSLLSGSVVAIAVDYGVRSLTPSEAKSLIEVFLSHDNFVVREWGPQTLARRVIAGSAGVVQHQHVFKGTVRNGQVADFPEDVVVIGDINPGGAVVAGGDIYVFGRLRGIAHAGCHGNGSAIVAAAEFSPMQLRIADVVSRSPEAEDGKPLHTFMEFAYLRGDVMAVDKMVYRTSLVGVRNDEHFV